MGDIDNKRQEIPTYRQDRKRIQLAVGKTYHEIMDFLIEELYGADVNINRAKIEGQLAEYVQRLQKDVAIYTNDSIRKAFKQGRKNQLIGFMTGMNEQDLREFAEEQASNLGTNSSAFNSGVASSRSALLYSKLLDEIDDWQEDQDEALEKMAETILGSTGKVAERQVQALVVDTYQDILEATENTLPSIKKVVRDTVRDITQLNTLTGEAYETQAKAIKKRLTKEGLSKSIRKKGFVGITDKAGRRWDVGTYSDMVTRTKLNQAYRNGVEIEGERRNMDLAVISDHGAEDACKNWEGVVVSLKGKTEGFPTLKEAKSTNEVFHPNCQHSLHLIRDVDQLSSRDRKKFERQLNDLGNYRQRQKY